MLCDFLAYAPLIAVEIANQNAMGIMNVRKKTWHFVVLKQTHICAKETKNEQRGLTAIDEAMKCKPEIITLLQRQNHHHFFPRVLFP